MPTATATDPTLLTNPLCIVGWFYSMYGSLQNVNTLFLDCRPGPTLSCLVAEKVKLSTQLLFCHNNKTSGKVKMKKGGSRRLGGEGQGGQWTRYTEYYSEYRGMSKLGRY